MDDRDRLNPCAPCRHGPPAIFIDPDTAINLHSTRSAIQRRGAADLIGAAASVGPCDGNAFELQSLDAGGGAFVVRHRSYDSFNVRLLLADELQVWWTRTSSVNDSGGTAFTTGNNDATYARCDGAEVLDTPNGHRLEAAQMSHTASATRIALLRMSVRNSGFETGQSPNSTQNGLLSNLLLTGTKCVDTSTAKIWGAGIEELFPGKLYANASHNDQTPTHTECGGASIDNKNSRTSFIFVGPSTQGPFAISTLSDAQSRVRIEAWEDFATQSVIDFANVPQTPIDVGSGCWTPMPGGWGRHGPIASIARRYAWEYLTPGLGPTQDWPQNSSLIVHQAAGQMWPACVVPV